MSTRILLLVENAGPHERAEDHDVERALPDLAGAWRVLEDAGCEVLLVSPAGGAARIDAGSEAWADDPVRRVLLARTAAPSQVDAGDFDAVACLASTAGAAAEAVHASPGVERIARSVDAHGGVVAAAGHADCALVALVGGPQVDATAQDAARAIAARLAG